MNDLTKAEEQIMHYVWKLEKAFLKDIVQEFPEPKPAYTTISTVVSVLVRKKYLDYKTYGKVREYFATISKEKYFKQHIKQVTGKFFSGSTNNLALFFTEKEEMNLTELEKMKQLIESKIEQLKENNE
ncbi:MAG: BlaI/MecI/CopY family transcriptional regulator [Flavobacteriales bacterium]|nr:BlaI/MecI/CopY family transcriptional regulator [Flavobacteriales bacterium]